jgi:NAD-dependent deacetylase
MQSASTDNSEFAPAFAKQLDLAASVVVGASRVAVLTGAGISAESGLPTFRGAGGLWEGYAIEEVATPMAFERNPSLVWRFYHARRAALRAARPNPGHVALKALEDLKPAGSFTLLTQNVDGLHRAAGNRNILELHGSLSRVRCSRCERVADWGLEPLDDLPTCKHCEGLLRPDVVWFYEPLPEGVWSKADAAARACDCFLVVGTSAIVYPAAGLVDIARDSGAKVIEANIEASAVSAVADITLLGPSGKILPELIKRLQLSKAP